MPTSARGAMAEQVVCRAATKQFRSAGARWPLGAHSPSARQKLARPVLAERSLGLVMNALGLIRSSVYTTNPHEQWPSSNRPLLAERSWG